MTNFRSKYLIYGLLDPRDQELKYIGKSCSGLGRPASYHNPSTLRHEGNTKKTAWIKELFKLKLDYEITILEEVETKEQLIEAEEFSINYYKFIGCDLLNMAKGGAGGGYKLSEETKRKIGEANIGRKLSDVTKQKMSVAGKGRKQSAEHTSKIVAFHTGRKRSLETKLRISEALKGNAPSDNTLSKFREFVENRQKQMLGRRFGRLVVNEKGPIKHGRLYWVCSCDCGNLTTVDGIELRRTGKKNGTKSCGCYGDEVRHNLKKYRSRKNGRKHMEKLGVVVEEEVVTEKTAKQTDKSKCPDCSTPVSKDTNVAHCPKDGTQPFESVK